jgi:hypothetical protein
MGSFLFGLLCMSACDGGTENPLSTSTKGSAAKDAAPSVSAVSSAGTGPAAIQARADTPTALGGADPEKVTLQARYTPRARLLKQLATQFGFQVLGRAGSESNVDIDVDEVPLEAALAALLEGEPYALQYAANAGSGRRIQLVLLGDLDQHMETLRGQRIARRRKERNQNAAHTRTRERTARQEILAALSKEERVEYLERENAERAERRREAAEIARTQLYSDDPEERANALEHLDEDTIGIAELLEFAQRDPDGGVRSAALDQLTKRDTPAAKDAIRSALDDPDPRVIIEAIDELTFEDTPRNIALLEPLLRHPDPKVVEAAQDGIEFLEP